MQFQSSFSPQYLSPTNPIYYEQKANKLRIQNQLLKKQLQNQNTQNNSRYQRKYSPNQQTNINEITQPYYQDYNKRINYQGPQRTVVYRRVGQPVITERVRKISPQRYQKYVQPDRIRASQSYHNYPVKQRQVYPNMIPSSSYYNQTSNYERNKRYYINQVQQDIIQLQTHGFKLQRQANKLTSFIKEDLRDFVRDSNIHKECNYKKKYLKAISNRPMYVRFNM